MRRILSLALVVALSLPAAALAAGPTTMKPGLWQLTVKMSMAGLPTALPARTFKRCITRQDIDKNQGVPKPRTENGMTCTVKKHERSRNTEHYTVACTGKQGSMTVDGTTTYDSDSAYHAEVHTSGTVDGRATDTTEHIQASRVGDCGQ